MNNNLILAVFLMVVISGCSQQQPPAPVQGKSPTAYFSISDPGMSLTGVTSIEMTVSKMTIHNQGKDSWIDIITSERTLNLIQLKADKVKELVGEITLEQGSYNQIRLDVAKVLVTFNGSIQEAKLPSNVLRIPVDMQVTNESILLNLEFKAEDSLHMTGEGKIIMAPVINVDKYVGAEVQKEGKNIDVKDSKEHKQDTVGMDENGNIGQGKRIGPSTELETDEQGNVVIKKPTTKGTGNLILTIKDKNENKSTNRSIKTETGLNVTSLIITVSNVSVHKAGNGSGWIIISAAPKSFSLLELQDVEAVLGEKSLEAGQYTQIRLDITDSTGVIDGKAVNVTIPSRTLKLVGVIKVEENKTSLATIDFVIEKSLSHIQDKYVLKPVIKLITRTGVKVNNRTQNQGREEIEYSAGNTTDDREIRTE